MLPKQIYYVFIDNLFSLPNLFYALREAGYRATGIACPNCGITKKLKLAKGKDKAGALGFKYNKVKLIPIIHNLIYPRDLFIYISLTNSSFLGRSNRLEG
jgi:ssDNA-binding Zn-finger/Zn-ribbon topoisomerase 1